MNKISAYIISYNREDVIEACIKSLWFADEIVLVDKSSTDSTVAIAAKYADIVKIVPWTPTVEETRQFAESLCSHDWIIFLDDDEVLNSNGAQYVKKILANPRSYIYKFPRNEYILSRHSKFAYYYPNTQIRMYKKGALKNVNSVHNGYKIIIDSICDIPISSGVYIDHFSHYNVFEWIEKANKYTSAVDRMRFYEASNIDSFEHFVQSILSRWLNSQNEHASYENIVGILRGIYDLIDFCKDWESKNVSNTEMQYAIAHSQERLDIPKNVILIRNNSLDADFVKITSSNTFSTEIDIIKSSEELDYELYDEYNKVKKLNLDIQNSFKNISTDLNKIKLSKSYRIINLFVVAKSLIFSVLKKAVNRNRSLFRGVYYSRHMPPILRAVIAKHVRSSVSDAIFQPQKQTNDIFPNEIESNILLKYIYYPQFKDIVVSIIIPAYGKLPVLLQCLNSIFENPPKCEYEVIVIEDASGDSEISRLKEMRGLRFIENEINLGFTLNCNKASKFANGQFLYFLNDDTVILRNTIDAMLDAFQDPTIGLVGSKLVYPNNVLQEAGGIVWSDGSAWNFGRGMNPDNLAFNYQRDVDYCSGASLLIKKSVFEEVGKFDEIYTPAYCEDTDLAFKVRSLGLRVVYEPKSTVIHYEGRSHGTDLGSGIKAHQVNNQKKFFKKWQTVLKENHYLNGTNLARAIHNDKKQKFILFIDNNIPFFGADAGSKTVIELLKVYKNSGFLVHFIPLNSFLSEDAKRLQNLGIHVLISLNPMKYISDHSDLYSKILISRPEPAYLVVRTASIPSHKIIYYGHDIHYMRLESKHQLLGINDGISSIEHKEKKVWESCGLILYPSNEEVVIVKEYLKAAGSNTEVHELPVYISRNIDPSALLKHGDRSNLLFVGSGHDPNIDAVNYLIHDIWPLISKSLLGITLHIVGSVCDKIPDADFIVKHGLVSDDELEKLYQVTRVFVAPLRYGMGVKGKIIDAIDFRCAVVTTDIGVQGIAGAQLVPVNTASEFASHVVDLYLSEIKWNKHTKQAAEFVHKNYTSEKVLKALDL